MTLRIGIAFVLGLACACKRWDYHCTRDEQCISQDLFGTCEPEGWCSYADGRCPSGRRWGPQAGPFGNACMKPSDDTSSSSSTSSSSNTSSSSSTSSSSG